MKKMIRNVGAVLSVGGIGVYTVYKMVFGRTKKTDEMEMIQGKQYEPYAPVIRSGMEKAGKLPFQRIFPPFRDDCIHRAAAWSPSPWRCRRTSAPCPRRFPAPVFPGMRLIRHPASGRKGTFWRNRR